MKIDFTIYNFFFLYFILNYHLKFNIIKNITIDLRLLINSQNFAFPKFHIII